MPSSHVLSRPARLWFAVVGLTLALFFPALATAQAPTITSLSAPRQVVTLGQNLTLSVTASSASSYQWKRNGRPVSGANSTSFTISSAMPGRDNGWYQVVATNASGSTASAAVFVNVSVPSPQILEWGYHAIFARSAPYGLTQISAVAVDINGGMALKQDGTVVAWGPLAPAPAGLSGVVAISANWAHGLALKSDGTVVGWGDNSSGQASVPAGLSDVVAVAGGVSHSVALKRNGTVVAWGSTGTGTGTDVPMGLSNVIGIASGMNHCLAVKSDGTVVSWGSNTEGQSTIPDGLNTAVAVAAGGVNSAAIKSDGTVVAWGYNFPGSSNPPAGLTNVVQLVVGDSFYFALRGDRTTAFWGHVSRGNSPQVNYPNTVYLAAGWIDLMSMADASSSSAPTVVTHPAAVTTGLGQTVTFSVSVSGTAPLSYQWQVQPAGTSDFVNVPYQPANYSGATTASLTVGGTTASMRGDEFRCVVSNGIGLPVASSSAALTVAAAPVITSPANTVFPVGIATSFAVTATGAPPPTYRVSAGALPAWAALDETTGVLSGMPTSTAGSPFTFTIEANNDESPPATQVFTLSVVVAPIFTASPAPRQTVISGRSLSLSATATGATSYQWKRNGLPLSGATASTLTITNATPWRDSGWYQLVATNASGASTTGPVVFVNVVASPPILATFGVVWAPAPTNLTSVSALAGGSVHTLALQGDGTVVGWGLNNGGQLNIPVGLANVVGLWAVGYENLALKSDGTVVSWGNVPAINAVPVGLSSVVQLALGAQHALALKANGTVVAWGSNSNGETSVPAGLTGVIAIAAGISHSLALKVDGTVVVWGSNSYGQSTVPAGLAPVAAIVASADHSVVLKRDGTVAEWGNTFWSGGSLQAGLTAVALVTGQNHGLALQADGTVIGWGSNSSGETTFPAGTNKVIGFATNSGTSFLLRDGTVNTPSTITSQPVSATHGVGQTATFTVAATGTAPLSYQWQRQAAGTTGFVDLAASATYSGVTTATLSVVGTTVLMAGDQFRCVVSNGVGSPATSAAVTLTISAPPVFTSAASATFFINRVVSFTVAASGPPAPTFAATGLPSWAALNATTGVISGTAPDVTGAPFLVTLTATNGVAPAATQTFALNVSVAHSADTSPTDGALNLTELTRVIALYNTRQGTVRTGRYLVQIGTEDGFAPDAAGTGASPITALTAHSADSNHDGHLSLPELTRVLELFGARTGSTRTGAYRVQAGSEDGFAPGP